ncbi:hypothetical protein IQ251_05755 [Saccharopolyspora sp. HNM0983]|uniref:Uncharacterized protein n=1 Tax=Saccharopolyspora montiporae TaxID=2781240 RepID=A0A929B665_9PSEU|nr:hypothetical protein [Saccharopolyspora sp. HNM0983]MBE9373949.1 hypothetical protein [Saccharopolyspora sp. HNM0983]
MGAHPAKSRSWAAGLIRWAVVAVLIMMVLRYPAASSDLAVDALAWLRCQAESLATFADGMSGR